MKEYEMPSVSEVKLPKEDVLIISVGSSGHEMLGPEESAPIKFG